MILANIFGKLRNIITLVDFTGDVWDGDVLEYAVEARDIDPLNPDESSSCKRPPSLIDIGLPILSKSLLPNPSGIDLLTHSVVSTHGGFSLSTSI